MAYWAKDGSFVREASDDNPRRTQGDDWEAQQRINKGMQDWEREEARRKAGERETSIGLYETQKMVQQQRADALNYERNQQEAVRLIVEQKRQEYNKKSWFGKAIATLRGKSFANMRAEIEENAINRVDRWSPEYLERFIEKQTEGRSR